MQWVCASILVLLSTAWCQQLPNNLQNLKEKFGISILLEDVQDAVKSRCEKKGGDDAFDKLETAAADLQECIQSNFNITEIMEEIAIKRKTGDLDEVFAKYCSKVPIVKECLKTASQTAETCMEEKEKETLKLALNIFDSLASFACYKDGDRIAMFIAEKSPECIQSRQGDLEQCANEILSQGIPTEINNFPLFGLEDTTEACSTFSKLQSCVVKSLEQCDKSIPANVVEAVFELIRRVSACEDLDFPVS